MFRQFLNIMSGFMSRTVLDSTAKPSKPDDELLKEGGIESMADFADGLNAVMKRVVGPILTVIGVLAIVYAIYLGVMYAKAEDANKRREVQGRLIGACVGAVIIVVAVTLCFSINWADVYWALSGKHTAVDTNSDGYCDYCTHTNGDSNYHGA